MHACSTGGDKPRSCRVLYSVANRHGRWKSGNGDSTPWVRTPTASGRVDVVGEALRDVVVAEPAAHDVGVLQPAGTAGIEEGVVVRRAGAGLGEPLHAQLLQQGGDPVVDVLAAVVGVEAEDAEREGQQQAFEQRHEEALGDADDGADELVLGDPVHQVDEVQALDPVAVANVDAVHAWTVSTRTWPGSPSGSGAWRTPIVTAAAWVFVQTVRLVR